MFFLDSLSEDLIPILDYLCLWNLNEYIERAVEAIVLPQQSESSIEYTQTTVLTYDDETFQSSRIRKPRPWIPSRSPLANGTHAF